MRGAGVALVVLDHDERVTYVRTRYGVWVRLYEYNTAICVVVRAASSRDLTGRPAAVVGGHVSATFECMIVYECRFGHCCSSRILWCTRYRVVTRRYTIPWYLVPFTYVEMHGFLLRQLPVLLCE